MTKKKNSKKQNTAEKQAQQEEPKEKELNTSSEEIQEEEIATCDEDINSLETQIEELKDKHLRLFSEFDNFRKRTTKERIELFKTANADLLLDLIPVLDDFDRAMKSFEDAKDIESVRQGVELIYNKFNTTLEKKGLQCMDSQGKDFDTDFHEAITEVPAPSEDLKSKVMDVVEKGYTLNEKVIRYAKVVVGK